MKTKLFMKVGDDFVPAPIGIVHETSSEYFIENPHSMLRKIGTPKDTEQYLLKALRGKRNEAFCAIFLDNRHRVLAFRELFQGTIDNTTVYPRVVVQTALELNAAAVIFAHNHPSGEKTPSQADVTITKRLKEALDLVDIRVLDHFVVGHEECVSMASRGMM